jgi:intergrase/recombinase
VKTVTVPTVHSFVHDLYIRVGLLEKNPLRRKYELRTHSFRRFFRTQMASLEVDPDCIDFMMGRTVKDRYHDVRMKGVEYLRGVYMASGIRIRPKIKMNKIDALKEILQTWGLNPQKILSHEALAQITQPTMQEQADNRDLVIPSETSQNHRRNGSPQESTDGST